MEPTWVLSAPDGPHVGPMNLAIWGVIYSALCWCLVVWYSQFPIGQTNTGAMNGVIAISTSLLYYNAKLKPSILTESTFYDLNNEMGWIGVLVYVVKGQKASNKWALYNVYHRRWSWEIEKYFHPTHYNGSKYLSMLGLKLNHVSKRGLLVVTSKHYNLLNQCASVFLFFSCFLFTSPCVVAWCDSKVYLVA